MPPNVRRQIVVAVGKQVRIRRQDPVDLADSAFHSVDRLLEASQRAGPRGVGHVADVVDALRAADGLLVKGQDVVREVDDVAERRQRGEVQLAVLVLREGVIGEDGVGICLREPCLHAQVPWEAESVCWHRFAEVVLHVGALDELQRSLDDHGRAVRP